MTQPTQPGPQPAAQPTAPAAAPAQKEHIVAAGETVEQIAAKYGVSADALRRANNLFGQPLQVGQKLRIPSAQPAAPPTAPKVPPRRKR